MEKLKVAFICHFSNQEIRRRLPLSKMGVKSFIGKVLRKKPKKYGDSAAWVTNLIKEFEQFDDVELHVIAPHRGLKTYKHDFELRGVWYHFFKPDIPIIHKELTYRYRKLLGKCNYVLNRWMVRSFIKDIKPDIVNLIGAENPYYSITSLDIKEFPVYVSLQTVYSNPDRAKRSGAVVPMRLAVERQVHQKERYFGCGSRMHCDLLLENNPDAIVFKMHFPFEMPEIRNEIKEYDFVFFAGLAKQKGVEDLLKAVSIVKRTNPEVSLHIIGGFTSDPYRLYLEKMSSTLGLCNNIVFKDYFPTRAAMHLHASKARFAVQPVMLDAISGAVLESIALGLPVVTYKTHGMPYLNRDGQSVLMGEIGDVDVLAENMCRLMGDEELAKRLKNKARRFIKKEFDSKSSAQRLIDSYKAVIDHWREGQAIPEELLFNTEEFPKYE